MTVVGMTILAIILVAAAIVFMVAELFLPTHGVLGIAGILCAAAAVVLVMWVNPMLGMLCAIVLLIVAPIAVYRLVKAYPTTPVGKRVLLEQPAAAPVPAISANLLGARGRTITFLRPAGVVEINGRRVDCVSEGDVIDADKTVIVVSLSNGRVVVRESTDTAATA